MTVTRCKICATETIRSQVDRMVFEGVSDDGISRALSSVGVEISKSSILRHRTNHAPAGPLDGVELSPDMVVPRPNLVDVPPPMGDGPAKLLEEIRAKVAKGGSETDITRDRLVRETLLSRIFESQLAITVSALDRFQTGEGRYPLDMVRGLQAVSAMFEKTSLQTVATTPMQNDLFEREVERRENLVYQDAKNRALAGDRVPREVPDEYLQPKSDYGAGHTSFYFGRSHMEGWMYNNRMRRAWEDGVRDGKAEKKLEVEDVQSEA